MLCQNVEGYGTMKEALGDTLMRVAIAHLIGHSAISWLNEELIDNHQLFGQTLYHLHLCHLSESNVSGVNPCLPDRTQLGSCLGMDQVIVSAIENEKNNVSFIGDIASC